MGTVKLLLSVDDLIMCFKESWTFVSCELKAQEFGIKSMFSVQASLSFQNFINKRNH